MKIILFEDEKWSGFLPLVFTRPVGDLRFGILKMSEKWGHVFNASVSHITRPHLLESFPVEKVESGIYINSRLHPDQPIIDAIEELKDDEALMKGDILLAAKFYDSSALDVSKFFQKEYSGNPFLLEKITDLFSRNAEAIRYDFSLLMKGETSAALHPSNTIIGSPDQLFLSEGAKVLASTINTTDGPVYIGPDAEVMEGSHIRGPFALCDHSTLKMGAKIYGPTTIGPHCKVGGEVSNSIFHGYSNKAHDGFLGNSIIGEWCNLGADTNNSNLKNNYSNVKIWSYTSNQYSDTGLTFCGLIMGDHSKCGINTMLNTGTVVGVSSNIFGGDFPPKHVASFSWGGSNGFETYDLQKAFATMEKVMSRRNLPLSPEIKKMLTEVFALSEAHRAITTQSQE
jgi:UDP-N-acetylglucosamine diphosphorylase/glucosamine-1-phosphate N-acetyltransferase